MPHFAITSPGEGRWNVRLANCTREHADSVRLSLEKDPHLPFVDFVVREVDEHWPHAAPADVVPAKRSLWKRLLRKEAA